MLFKNKLLFNRLSLIYLLPVTLCPNYLDMVSTLVVIEQGKILSNAHSKTDDFLSGKIDLAQATILIASHTEDQSELFARAEKAYQQLHLAEAASYLEKILATNSDNAKAHNLLGKMHQKMGRMQLAETEYRKAAQADSKWAEPRYNLAMLLFDRGDLSQSAQLLEEALNREPKNFEYAHDLALDYELLGDYKKALDCYQKAVRLKPKNSDCQYSLGLIM